MKELIRLVPKDWTSKLYVCLVFETVACLLLSAGKSWQNKEEEHPTLCCDDFLGVPNIVTRD